ncbi:MAG TPA: YbaK/EbsC family protein [Candidatus Portnoybacteria bacterium]|nr:YbaK/EbsC family protein [Candidatus Portnoybacteria bacterium]
MLNKTIQKFLDLNKTKYEVIEHKTVYTAFDKAATLRAKPQEVGKTVVVSLDNKEYALGLIPSNKNLDKKKVLLIFNKLRAKNKEKNYKKIDFAKEQWMKKSFKGVALGATPPLGELYKLPFFIDNALTKPSKIVVNGGAYEVSLKLSPANLIKLNQNSLKGSFSMAKK